MNTKIQLFIIVIVAFLSVSSAFTTLIDVTREKNETPAKVYYSAKAGAEVSNIEAESILLGEISLGRRKDEDIKGLIPEDDGITHHFHLERVRNARRHTRMLCFLAKFIVILAHIALMICGYCHCLQH
jgi:hypothetical protein